jgi:PAS domain-containing protein
MNARNQNQPPPFPARLLTGALAISVLLMVGLGWSAYRSYRTIDTVQLHSLRIKELQGVIVHLDEVLTMSARMAAATGDLAWERRYRQFEPQLDAAIKEATTVTSESGSADAAAQTDAANRRLVEMESQSFALVREGRSEAARAVLFSREYETQKKIYAEGTVELDRQLGQHLKGHEKEQRREAGFCILASAVVVGLLLLTWLTVLSRLRHWRTIELRSFDRLAHAKEELRNAHSLLEMRVQERTAEVQTSEKRMRAITDSAHNAILMMDPEGRVSYWNPAAERILGYTSAEAIGQNLHKLIAPARHHQAHHDAFLSDAVDYLQAIRAGVAGNDAEGLRRATHALKGASASIGAQKLAELCAQLGVLGAAGQVAGAGQRLAQLQPEFAHVKNEIEKPTAPKANV